MLKFLLPSMAGLIVFLGPVVTDARQTVVFGLVTDAVKHALGTAIDEVLLLLLLFAAALPLARFTPWRPRAGSVLAEIMAVNGPWQLFRWLGFAVVACVYFGIGPELLRLPDTGQTVVRDIGHNVLVIYLVGLLLMPLLTDYGLMEFAGTLCRPLFRRLFRLPGRSAIDSLTSIAAASAVGLLVTISQYQRGFYTAREACTIACSFSLVSIPFALLVAQIARIDEVFFGWYLTVLVATVLIAMVICRVPPLSRIEETRLVGAAALAGAEEGGFGSAVRAALARAEGGPGPVAYLRRAARGFAVTSTGVMGPSLATATIAAIALFHTQWVGLLAAPLALGLELLEVSNADLVASGMLIGFLDQFLPTLVAADLQDVHWRFILAGLSIVQIVFLAEFGVLVLRSPLPLSFVALALVFMLRTTLALPVLWAGAKLLL